MATALQLRLFMPVHALTDEPRQFFVAISSLDGCGLLSLIVRDALSWTHRPDLRNLFLPRNDPLLNNFEPHLLLANLGNIDWRALINLWSVLEYLTKYTAKAGEGSKHLGAVFRDVLAKVDPWEEEDGVHDLWRRTIFKFYSRVIGDRDYTLYEAMHFGLRLPGTLSNFGDVHAASVSNWAPCKRASQVAASETDARVTTFSKLETFSARINLQFPRNFDADRLKTLSFYAFWRLFDVRAGRLVVHQWDSVVALTGVGWPSHARKGHELHASYAQKVLYAYMPCEDFSGTDYIDEAVRVHYENDWTAALEHFVRDDANLWCPKWIRRNYETQNKSNLLHKTAQGAVPPHEQSSVLFEEGTPEPSDSDSVPEAPKDAARRDWQAPRAAWQEHSRLGPNVGAEPAVAPEEPFPDVVNCAAHPGQRNDCCLDIAKAGRWWDPNTTWHP